MYSKQKGMLGRLQDAIMEKMVEIEANNGYKHNNYS